MKRLYSWAGDSKVKKAVAFLVDVLVTFAVVLLLLFVCQRIFGGQGLTFDRVWYIALAASAAVSAVSLINNSGK